MAYVELNGVRTWFDQRGVGEPLILLHPGGVGVDSRAFGAILDVLAERFNTFTPDRRGHGRTPDVDGPISYELMAEDTIAFVETVVGESGHLLGYSDGAIVALYVALRRPDLVRGLVHVAGVFHRDGWIPQAIQPDIPTPEFLAARYREISPDGPGHLPVVADKLARMHAEEPTLTVDDLKRISNRVLVMAGDDDEPTLEHTIALYRGLTKAELAIIPGTSHGLLVEKPELCSCMIIDFLTTDPVQTVAPIRRTISPPA